MTVDTSNRKIKYMGDGTTTEFTIPFPFFRADSIKAQIKKKDFPVTPFTDFDISGINDDGEIGIYAITGEPIPNGAEIMFYRETSLTQETDYKENANLSSETLERDFDNCVMQTQELSEELGRCLKLDMFDSRDSDITKVLNACDDAVAAKNETLQLKEDVLNAGATQVSAARAWAIGDDVEVPEQGEHSSKGNAALALAIANADEDMPIAAFDTPAAVILKGERGEPAPQLAECLKEISNTKRDSIMEIDLAKQNVLIKADEAALSAVQAKTSADRVEQMAVSITPVINEAGNWVVAGMDTSKPSRGIQGIQGIQGEKGLKGDTGAQGVQGAVGSQGIQGPKGDKGNTGPQGLQGIKGDMGPQGPIGEQGSKGEKGDKGETGPQGIKGENGDETILINYTFAQAGSGLNVIDNQEISITGITGNIVITSANGTGSIRFTAGTTSITIPSGQGFDGGRTPIFTDGKIYTVVYDRGTWYADLGR